MQRGSKCARAVNWRVDDSMYPLIGYLYYRLLEFSEFDEHHRKLVREWQLTGREALERCVSKNSPRIPSLVRTFEELKDTKEDVGKALNKCQHKLLKKLLTSTEFLSLCRSKKQIPPMK